MPPTTARGPVRRSLVRLLAALVLGGLLRPATAATLALPPGEDGEDWVDALSLAGLEPGGVPAGEGAWLVPGPAGWRLEVRDRTGARRSALVAPPRGPADREEIAWLAVSLLEPVAAPPPVVVAPPAPASSPAPRPRPRAPAPAPSPAPAPAPEPTPVVVAPSPAPPLPPPRPRARLAAGGAVGLGEAAAARGGLHLQASLRSDRGVWAGASGELWRPAALKEAPAAELGAGAVRAAAGVALPVPGAPRVGLTGGLASRTWRTGGRTVARAVVPTLGLGVDATLPLGDRAGLTASAGLDVDLRATRLRTDGGTDPVPPVGLVFSISPSWTMLSRPAPAPVPGPEEEP